MEAHRRKAAGRPVSAADRFPIGRSLSGCTAGQVRDAISRLLDASGLGYDDRFEVLGGALVSEAVRPYWEAGHAPDAAHDFLRRDDGELAGIVEALSPVLLGRAEARAEARRAVELVESEIFPSSSR